MRRQARLGDLRRTRRDRAGPAMPRPGAAWASGMRDETDARRAEPPKRLAQSQRRVSLYSPAGDFSLIVMHLPWRVSSRQLPSALVTRSPFGTRLPSLIS